MDLWLAYAYRWACCCHQDRCIGKALIDKAVGEREAGSSWLDNSDSPFAKSTMKVCGSDCAKKLQNGRLLRTARSCPCCGARASIANIIISRREARHRVGKRNNPHYARLIRWLAVRPRCRSSVAQMLVSGAQTYLAGRASSRHIPPDQPWSIVFAAMTWHSFPTRPIVASPWMIMHASLGSLNDSPPPSRNHCVNCAVDHLS